MASPPTKKEGAVETIEFSKESDPLHPANLIVHLTEDEHRLLDDPEILKAWMDPSLPNREEETRMVRKVDLRMMPILWVMYVLNYLDRTNIGNAKVAGMDADLHMNSADDYSIALLIFFIGYLLFEVPSNIVMARTKPSVYLSSIMLVWGSMTLIYMAVRNFTGLVILRFFLGIVESGFFPGVLLLLSAWYKREELSKRIAIFHSASIISGAFGGVLAAGVISGMEGLHGIRGWRWLYMIEGVCTVSAALLALFILPNFPRSTTWLTPREKALAMKRLAIQAATESAGRHVGTREGLMMAVRDWKTWVLTLGYSAEAGAGTITYFIPSLVSQLGYKATEVQWFSAPIYVVAFVFSIAINFHADYRREKVFHAAVPAVCAGIFAIVQATGRINHIASYVLLCFVGAGIWSSLPCLLSYAIIIIGEPPAKRAVTIAIVNSVGNVASIYGSFLWPSSDAPAYHKGWGITAAFCFLAAFVALFVRFVHGPTYLGECRS